MEITKNTKIGDILEENPKAAEILFKAGMACAGCPTMMILSESGKGCRICPMAMQETLEEGAKAHGMKDEDLESLLKKLNKK